MHYILDDRYESAVARVQAAALTLNSVTGEPCIDALKIALADVFGIVPEGVREDDEKDQPESDEDEADFIEGGPFPNQPPEFVPMTPDDERWIEEGVIVPKRTGR